MSNSIVASAVQYGEEGVGILSKNISNSPVNAANTDFMRIISNGKNSIGCVEGRHVEQGPLQPFNSPVAIAVEGTGYFVTKTNAGELRFTRDGQFEVDKDGNIIRDGLLLYGWELDSDTGALKASNSSDITLLKPVNVGPSNGFSKATTSIGLGGIVKAGVAVGSTSSKILTVIDSLGATHSLTALFTKVSESAVTQNQVWSMAVTSSDGSITRSDTGGAYSVNITFNGSGVPTSVTNTSNGNTSPPDLVIDWTSSSATTSTVSLDVGTINSSNGLVVQTDANQPENVALSKNTQNGFPYGHWSGIEISEKGDVIAKFDNTLTAYLFRVPLAYFSTPSRLDPKSGSAFEQTIESGPAVLGSAATSGFGRILSKHIEKSSINKADTMVQIVDMENYYTVNTNVLAETLRMQEQLLQLFH